MDHAWPPSYVWVGEQVESNDSDVFRCSDISCCQSETRLVSRLECCFIFVKCTRWPLIAPLNLGEKQMTLSTRRYWLILEWVEETDVACAPLPNVWSRWNLCRVASLVSQHRGLISSQSSSSHGLNWVPITCGKRCSRCVQLTIANIFCYTPTPGHTKSPVRKRCSIQKAILRPVLVLGS